MRACPCPGLLGLIDELTAGTLLAPAGLPLEPTLGAVAWAEGDASLVPVEAWPVLGVPGASTDTALVRPFFLFPVLCSPRGCFGACSGCNVCFVRCDDTILRDIANVLCRTKAGYMHHQL